MGWGERLLTPRSWVRPPHRAFVQTIALAKLVATYLARELVKDSTLSDWSDDLDDVQLQCEWSCFATPSL